MEYKPSGERYDINDLLQIMQILRSENGCPWDKIQTHESIRMNFVEEVYEALEAIEQNDPVLLQEELGDVLLQIVYHARMEEEFGHFSFADVVHDVCYKLIIRHPHIFSQRKADTVEQVLTNWNEIKRQTKGQTTYTQTLQSVAKTLPGLMRAQKIYSRSIKAGVLPVSNQDILQSIQQQTAALSNCTDKQKMQQIIGAILYDAVKLSENCGYSAEELLERKADAYICSFEQMEQTVTAAGKQIQDCDPEFIQRLIQDQTN